MVRKASRKVPKSLLIAGTVRGIGLAQPHNAQATDFVLRDVATGEFVVGVPVDYNDDIKFTDSNGEVSFPEHQGGAVWVETEGYDNFYKQFDNNIIFKPQPVLLVQYPDTSWIDRGDSTIVPVRPREVVVYNQFLEWQINQWEPERIVHYGNMNYGDNPWPKNSFIEDAGLTAYQVWIDPSISNPNHIKGLEACIGDYAREIAPREIEIVPDSVTVGGWNILPYYTNEANPIVRMHPTSNVIEPVLCEVFWNTENPSDSLISQLIFEHEMRGHRTNSDERHEVGPYINAQIARYSDRDPNKQFPGLWNADVFARMLQDRTPNGEFLLITYGLPEKPEVGIADPIPPSAPLVHSRIENIFPNPFNPSTQIQILSRGGQGSISAYALTGQQVTSIFEGELAPGQHSYRWNASTLSSGVYFIRFEQTTQGIKESSTRKAVILK